MEKSAEREGDVVPVALVETTEPVQTSLLQAIRYEAAGLHRGFANWPVLLGAITLGRLRHRPPALRMHVRHGPTVNTLAGDRSWRTVVECFGRDCYHLTTTAHLPSAPKVIDIGANIGAFTLCVLAARPRAQVAVYEPSPLALSALRANIAANCVQGRVAVHHGAVVGQLEPATVWLNQRAGDLCTSSILDLDETGRVSTCRIEVPAISLTTILSSHHGDIDLLKMDVEGAEYSIIEATPTGLLSKVRRMVVEYHDVPGRRVGGLAQQLHRAGLVWERQEHSALNGQGLASWVRP
jgi:FkbM family methyltransferase